jgi:hypothetical protein
MTLCDRILFHQIHAAKLVTDTLAAVISLYFLWRRDLSLAIAAATVPPLIATALVLRFADLKALKQSAFGAYVQRYMTPAMQLLRVCGFFDYGCCGLEPRSSRYPCWPCGHRGCMAQRCDYARCRGDGGSIS